MATNSRIQTIYQEKQASFYRLGFFISLSAYQGLLELYLAQGGKSWRYLANHYLKEQKFVY